MMTVTAFAEQYISVWEDGGGHALSLDPADPGNWTSGVCGVGTCCGSQHGVTAQALARYRGCPVGDITEATMRQLTVAEAAAIAVRSYYDAPGLGRLPWDPVVASVMDFGWNAGPRQATTMLQRLVGVAPDGAIGPATAQAYAAWIAAHGIEAAAAAWAGSRDTFYRNVATARPADAKFLAGWLRRTAYYLPGTSWWATFGPS